MGKQIKLSKKGEINQKGKKYGNDRQTKGNRRPHIDIEDINISSSHNNFLKINANAKDRIANKISVVNIRSFFVPLPLEKLGTIKTAPNQPAERLTNKSEMTTNKAGSIRISKRLTDYQLTVKIFN